MANLRTWLVPVGLAIAAASLVIGPTTAGSGTTHAGASTAGFVADAAAGWALIGAGVLSLVQRSIVRIGTLAVVAGAVWFAADWVGWTSGPAVVRSLAEVAMVFFLPIVIDIGVSASRPAPPWAARLVPAAYLAAATLSVLTAVVRDPIQDPGCWQRCEGSILAVAANPALTGVLSQASLLLTVVGGTLLAIVAAGRIRPVRRVPTDVIVLTSGLVGAFSAGHAVVVLLATLESPYEPVFALMFQARAWSTVALGIAIILEVARIRLARIALATLAASPADGPTQKTLEETLIEATGDRSLRVSYPRAGSEVFVDGHGAVLAKPPGGPGRGLLAIARDGHSVALVEHDPEVIDGSTLRDQIGASTRLAVDNERLRAELRAHGHELRESRSRIVTTGDHARQRLERDLHDGAQQRLIALGYDLALAAASVRGRAPGAAADLEGLRREARRALEELRQLAHGIFPAVLAESGLGSALLTLAERATIPVELQVVPDLRFGTMAETTAYVAIDEAVASAGRRGATFARVGVHLHEDAIVVTVEDDGRQEAVDVTHLADRVGAAGGSMSVEENVERGVTLRARIPIDQ